MNVCANPAVGCLLVTRFPLKVALLLRPDLAGRPVLVTDGGRVVAASPEARGVAPGQTVSAALSLCGNSEALPVDRPLLAQVGEELLAALSGVVPGVEPAGDGRYFLDVSGMAALCGGAANLAERVLAVCPPGLRPRLGLGDGKFPAFAAAARADAGGWIQAPTDVARWLAPWSLSWLPLDGAQQARLYALGIRTLGEVAALPATALADCLGPAGWRISELARGIDRSPVTPVVPPERYAERIEFPFPVDTVSGVQAAVGGLVEKIWRRPHLDGRRVGRVELEGALEPGDWWRFTRTLKTPAASAAGLRRTLFALMDAGNWPSGALVDLSLAVSDLSAEEGRQNGLWPVAGRRLAPSKIPGVERLAAVDRESALPERRWAVGDALRPLSAPEAVDVVVADDKPRRVRQGEGLWREVAQVVDLWDVETGWWGGAPERRRYWSLAMVDGALATVYRDMETGGWYRQRY